MRTLRIPTHCDEISPVLLADLIANLRKLCNLSGTGCTINELPNGISIDVPKPRRQRYGRLKEALYGCESAMAVVETIVTSRADSGGLSSCTVEGETFEVFDPLNKVGASLLADPLTGDFVPAGTCFECNWNEESQQWMVVDFGACCAPCAAGSGSEGSADGSLDSGSESGELGSDATGSGSGPCITPEMVGLPATPDDGQYVPSWKNGCFEWLAVGNCDGADSSGSGS